MTIPATLSDIPGHVKLVFYTPAEYPIPHLPTAHKKGSVVPTSTPTTPAPYAILFNFHGGGFTIGRPTDDCRWATHVLRTLRDPAQAGPGIIICSVEYRCAPECPFPTAVYDGADAILYVLQHAAEFNIDPTKVCTSGFSAGGNLSFTVLLKLWDELARRKGIEAPVVGDLPSTSETLAPHLSPLIRSTIAFYPSTDFTNAREVRRATNKKPSAELPRFFTRLFDSSYLFPPTNVSMDHPYLSPIVASNEALSKALPQHVVMCICEWDELRDEGERFARRLKEVGKEVGVRLVEGVGHAWDKNPFGGNPVRDEVYDYACRELGRALGLEYIGKEREGGMLL
ncbi:hypothetical protein HK097_007414 [Rhizophlyctis rosea]|uniref:Alpha/beta hydrolase fold-3 domain-containing protein n=1 Tax=Rhizophlyctis rosea TaxID=64517 RepID=A0AAD5SJW2_9FUNG|nr:hypothetical protein HK097_007414 [Rhizophlyctis rosea]